MPDWFYIRRLSLLLFGASLLLVSCGEDGEGPSKVDFDRKAMLTHWYEDQIQPSMEAFNESVKTLDEAYGAFHSQPTQGNLDAVKTTYEAAYITFQHVKFYEFGPSANVSFRVNLNTYPTDTAKIETLVGNGSFNGGAANQLDAQGFPALDYLFFSKQVDLINSPAHRNFAEKNLLYMSNLSQTVTTSWQTHRSAFLQADGTDVGSSLGQVVNNLNQDYELIKNAKIGFPAGKKTFGTPYPKTVEAYYSGISLDLAEANLVAIHNFYRGFNSFSQKQGLSLQDNLEALGTQAEGQLLSDLLDAQFQDAREKLVMIPGVLSNAVLAHTAEVDAAYSAIQLNVIYLKTDMPSALGVIITYQDNDGD